MKAWIYVASGMLTPFPCMSRKSGAAGQTDVDFAKHLIRIRQSVDAATRTVGAVKSKASSADLPTRSPPEA